MKFLKHSALQFALASVSLASIACSAYAQSRNLDFNTVIATWQPQQLSIESIDEAEEVLSSSRYLSASGDERERVTRFVNFMRKDITLLSAGQKERLVLLEARLLQGIHKFEQAQQHLKKINHSRSPAAQLLLADINMQQGNIKKAKEYCEKLVGQTSFLIAFTCMINADFSQNRDAKLLSKLSTFERYTSKARPAERQWFYEVLSDMALQLGNPETAIKHLAKTNFEQLPISAMLVWADAHFALENYETITSKLAYFVPDISTADDGLLLKWAIAERAQGIVLSEVQNQLAKNMEIRVWREDSSHAAQVATYFLEIEPDYPLALKFAELNWQFAQSLDDKRLLERARQANDVSTNA
ncbi:hypothetical protein KUC3_31530 [Alteromonas sp. KC3]|uniref:hypothetical protein n=1 Tax=unclassified Alteromonas TaxID=2614992 RepID=UPI001924DB86|nr:MULTISPECIES: hypothetical protein [unclassified Alteromonas]BCO20296.1 hypothetical protein KUC3_31530 [Alteromonas sp. KC3]BCO24262.1 hypothetical protein KUC14_31310 [Alteromonas sp. KC14]